MARNDIGPRIGVDGEAEYRKQIQNIIQQAKTLDSEMRLVAASFTDATTAQEKNEATARVLTKQIDTQRKRVEELANMWEKAAKELGENDTKTLQWKAAVNDATAELKRMEGQLQDTQKYTKGAGEAMEDAGKHTSSFADVLKANLLSDAIISGLRKLADLTKEAASYIVDVGMSFEAQMSKVEAISGASADDMEKLVAKAKEMGETTVFSASESAEALQYMAMAGWKTEDMLDGLPGVMNLAAASGEDLATTSDIVTDALTAFGLTAADSERFADVLAKTSNSANTNVAMMGETFKYAAPVAGALGYAIEDVAVAAGLMANAGVKGEQAGTALRGILSNLAKPSDTVAHYMEELGISLSDSSGEILPLSELLQNLRDSFADLSEAEKAEYASGLAGKNAMTGLLTLVSASDEDFAKLTEEIAAASGTAQEMANIMTDNLSGSLTLLKSAAEGVGISIYEQVSGPLKDSVDLLTDLLSGEIGAKDFATGIADILKSSGPELIRSGQEFTRNLMQGMIDSAPILIEAIVPLVSSLASGLLEVLPMLLELGGVLLVELARGITEAAPNLFQAIADTVIALATMLTDPATLTMLIEAGIELIFALLEGFIDARAEIMEQTPVIIDSIVTALLDNLEYIITAAIELALAIGTGMITAIPQIVAMLPEIFTRIEESLAAMDWASIGRNIVQGIINGLKNMWNALKSTAKDLANSVVSWVKGDLDINSPSGVFADEVGKMIPAGITLGIDRAMPAALRDMKAQFSDLPSLAAPHATATTNYGGVSINVYGAPGQDINALADVIMVKMDNAVRRKEAVYS